MLPAFVSRRQFVLGSAGALLAVRPRAQGGGPTAQQIVDRIRAAGPELRANSADGVKAGDPASVITGIVVAVMATMRELQWAVERGHNLVITHEPVFYGPNDDPGPRALDPVYLAKKRFIEDQRLVVYRMFEQWNALVPAAAADYLARSCGWRPPMAAADQVYDIPETTLGELLLRLTRPPGTRMVGDRALPVRRVCILPGSTTLDATMRGLERADAVIAGEAREWEAVPYVLDSISAGRPKGMILLGRLVTEDAAIGACAEWIRRLVPELPVGQRGFQDSYWMPR
jgi:hypothetical protein